MLEAVGGARKANHLIMSWTLCAVWVPRGFSISFEESSMCFMLPATNMRHHARFEVWGMRKQTGKGSGHNHTLDIWSVGILLYEMMADCSDFEVSTVDTDNRSVDYILQPSRHCFPEVPCCSARLLARGWASAVSKHQPHDADRQDLCKEYSTLNSRSQAVLHADIISACRPASRSRWFQHWFIDSRVCSNCSGS